jgi:aspartyl-tRNA(Asn)/glutamyl-tRNA(Gln) amidotransferase subunit B
MRGFFCAHVSGASCGCCHLLLIFAFPMEVNYEAYETVVGLEVHAQLLTDSKLFCGDSAAFGAEPNTHVSAITLAHPGTLPMMNTAAIGQAVKMGLACHCEIVTENYFARKNYFYPDLPKGYQLSQHTTPICRGGFITIHTRDTEKKIHLNRIHLEEDAGKSIHDAASDSSLIDFNRAGVALIEIVTDPDINSGEEASAYLTELRKIVRYLRVCDGNMEQGSLRCDANVSVRKKGDPNLGTKAEIKNLNSIRNVKRAIEFETARMIGLLEQNQPINQETRGFDADTGQTFAVREKEDADDYRYFPDPDLPKFVLTTELIESIQRSLPSLQPERAKMYREAYLLPEYDARVITEDREFAEFFEQIVLSGASPKAAANWLLGPVKSWLNERNAEIMNFPVSPKQMSEIIQLVENDRMSFSIAAGKLLALTIKFPGRKPIDIALEESLLQDSNANTIAGFADEVINRHPEKVKEYKQGKKGLLAMFVGEVMKLSKGNADPRLTNKILTEKLNA